MNEKTNSEQNSYLSFRLGTEIFAMNVKNILNILEVTKITKVPKVPGYMMGVINHRGIVLPVIDSRIKFNLEVTELTNNTCIIILELKNNEELISIGALIDEVREVFEIDNSDILPYPHLENSHNTDFLIGMINHEESFIMILDAEKVFAGNEIIDIQNIKKDIDNSISIDKSV